VSVSAAVSAVVAALGAAGQRVAVRGQDVTPPVCLVRIGSTTDAGPPMTGGIATTLWVFYVPIRGIDNLAGDAAALDDIYQALGPMTVAELAATASSVTVANETYACYRLDVTVWGQPDQEV
jgi:hypothetical protein